MSEYLNNGGGGNKTPPRCRFPAHSVRSARRHSRFCLPDRVAGRNAKSSLPPSSAILPTSLANKVWHTPFSAQPTGPPLSSVSMHLPLTASKSLGCLPVSRTTFCSGKPLRGSDGIGFISTGGCRPHRVLCPTIRVLLYALFAHLPVKSLRFAKGRRSARCSVRAVRRVRR